MEFESKCSADEFASLDERQWQAVQFVLGEMDDVAASRFEQSLESDPRAQQALIDAVELLEFAGQGSGFGPAVELPGVLPQEDGKNGKHDSTIGMAMPLVAAAAAVLALVAGAAAYYGWGSSRWGEQSNRLANQASKDSVPAMTAAEMAAAELSADGTNAGVSSANRSEPRNPLEQTPSGISQGNATSLANASSRPNENERLSGDIQGENETSELEDLEIASVWGQSFSGPSALAEELAEARGADAFLEQGDITAVSYSMEIEDEPGSAGTWMLQAVVDAESSEPLPGEFELEDEDNENRLDPMRPELEPSERGIPDMAALIARWT